jgi:catechol 2,3-dioxygenase-like lactoylglutathione lyase family enzyme
MDFLEINGLAQIDFTVTDIERSSRWWEEVMGFRLVFQREKPTFK